ncbi:MAG TPA: hypothetical protein DCE56_27115 [Cyanobacteria bacterium UBA8553]|nr:hypothetical protein [Cyanobacteria bacterium UBA8553]HAJ59774.1 hypothetical protein [Cyanobacteria bacterium UBA8543]
MTKTEILEILKLLTNAERLTLAKFALTMAREKKLVQAEVINPVSTIIELRLRYCTYPLTHRGLKSSANS